MLHEATGDGNHVAARASSLLPYVPVSSPAVGSVVGAEKTPAAGVRLGGYAFLILFLELALIRYVPGHVRVFGFYLNFVLLATFLGMGVGLLRADQAQLVRWLALPATLVLFGAVRYFANVVVQVPVDPDEYLWGQFLATAPTVQRVGIVPVAVGLFALCALAFVPLGALFGREFRRFPPLQAYSIDVAGSILGIAAFGLASALLTPPAVWFGLAFVVWVALSLAEWRFAVAVACVGAATLGLVRSTGESAAGRGARLEYWSPYYRIDLFAQPHLYTVDVNGSLHQYVLDLAPEVVAQFPALAAQRDAYIRPLRLSPAIDTVLVLGAGTGNDVALLLQLGAKHIDAVEIDPTILALGKAVHFQAPYADPRVSTHVDDARAFLRRTRQRYDLIVLGTLDSQTLLSGMSSLRLDNYVYTLEAFQSARARLRPGGHLVTYHESPFPYVAAKIDHLLTAAFGTEPVVFYQPTTVLFNYVFVAGDNLSPALGTGLPAEARASEVVVPRDDWPYLYLAHRSIPAHYLTALAAVLAIALGFGALAAGRSLRGGFDGPMFFMGVGFLLVETKSVTEMSLLFGSTWTVNLLVFSSILVMILVANLLVLRRPWRSVRAPFLPLWASLALAFAIPTRALLGLGVIGRWLAAGLLVGLPILFAATIFAMLLRTRTNATRALAYNLLGAMLGGVLEYSSMATGVKALYLIAAAAYTGAFLLMPPPGARRPA
jgi:SAM-dependent methyltransferase